jgi:hypothetical protein
MDLADANALEVIGIAHFLSNKVRIYSSGTMWSLIKAWLSSIGSVPASFQFLIGNVYSLAEGQLLHFGHPSFANYCSKIHGE